MSFVIQILLARLIEPREFGLLALLVIFTTISSLIIDGGFAQAIIQKKELTRIDISTVFLFNILVSICIYFILFWSAPAIASFYNEPRLVLLTRVLALNLIISSFGQVHNSLLMRELAFKQLLAISTPSIIVSGVVGVTLALYGFEVWALVAARFASNIVSTICLWVFADRLYWPRLEFSRRSFRATGAFGIGLLGASLLHQGMQNIYGLVIGKAFSLGQLAFYNRARSLQKLPTDTTTRVLTRVLFPVFSSIQDDSARIRAALRRGIPVVAFCVFPAMVALMCLADHAIVVLLTDKWLPSAPMLRWFPIIGMVFPIAAVQFSALRAKGRSGIFFWANLLKNVVAITTLVFTIRHDLLTVVIGQVSVAVFGHLFVNAPISSRVFGYKVRDQLADLGPYLIFAGLSAALCLMIGTIIQPDAHVTAIAIQSIVFFATYLAACYLANLRGLHEVSSYIKGVRNREVGQR